MKPNGLAVVEWNRPNGRNELEAINVKKLAVKGSVRAAVTDWVVLKCDHIICINCVFKHQEKLKEMKECGCG